VGASGKSSVAGGDPPDRAAEGGARKGGGVLDFALCFTLSAAPFGLRRAPLQAKPRTPNKKPTHKKGTLLTS